MLRFSEIHLRNWKNFGDVHINISDRLFIYGANAAGKSNLLDAFRFLKDVVNSGLQKAVNDRGGIKKIRNLNARSQNHIEIKVLLMENDDIWTYKLQFNAAGGTNDNRDVNVKLEQITKNGKDIQNRKHADGDYLSNQFTYLEQPAMNKEFRELYECFKAISYVNIIPQIIRESRSFIPSVSQEDFYGRNLLDTIASTTERTRNNRIKSIEKVLQLTVPQFSGLEFVKDEKGNPHLQVKYVHFRPHGAFQREDQFSDGTLRLIGIIWAILDGDGLLLLEEPELYLHSEFVKQLPTFIANAQKKKDGRKRTVIISSHSYDLINSDTIGIDEIVILEPGKEDTKAVLANTVPSIQHKIDAGFTPADAVIPQVTPKGIIEGQLSIIDLL